jgi:hypothetical protein
MLLDSVDNQDAFPLVFVWLFHACLVHSREHSRSLEVTRCVFATRRKDAEVRVSLKSAGALILDWQAERAKVGQGLFQHQPLQLKRLPYDLLNLQPNMLASRMARRLATSSSTSPLSPRSLTRPIATTRRNFVSPSIPDRASVSDKHIKNPAQSQVQEDPGPSDKGERFATSLPSSAEGHEGATAAQGGQEMFGFKLNPVATKTGGNAKSEGRPIYLDMQVSVSVDQRCFFGFRPIISDLFRVLVVLQPQATTPVDPRVLDAMLPYFTDQYGNPHSRTHAYGWEAEAAVDEARTVG